MSAIVADSPAPVSIVPGETDAKFFADALEAAERVHISMATYVEASMVLHGRRSEVGAFYFGDFFRKAAIQLEPVTLESGFIAVEAFRNYGRGIHPASLNYGDCFAYATADHLRLPLLCKGYDFMQTDLVCITNDHA